MNKTVSAAGRIPRGDTRNGLRRRIRAAWQGRVTGCLIGKPVEVLSFEAGRAGVEDYLRRADAWPLRGYVPMMEDSVVASTGRDACRGRFDRAVPDDDINYTVLALMLLERHGTDLTTEDVARAWLRHLPAGATWTAERAAYRVLLERMDHEFVNGAPPGFDLAVCADNEYKEWIGAQIRADLYGWVCPGQPALAADLAARDARLSHRGAGVDAAMYVAALAALIPASSSIDAAVTGALGFVPTEGSAAAAVRHGIDASVSDDGVNRLHERYAELSPVHALNNVALVVMSLLMAGEDFAAAVGDVVTAGWDTDCNGATVGGLLGLAGVEVPETLSGAWGTRIATDLAGVSEIGLDELVERTVAVTELIAVKLFEGEESSCSDSTGLHPA